MTNTRDWADDMAQSIWESPNVKELDEVETVAYAIREVDRKAESRGYARGIEDAAKECDRWAGKVEDWKSRYERCAAGSIGLAIRSLRSKEGA